MPSNDPSSPSSRRRLRLPGSPLVRRSLIAGSIALGFVGGGVAYAAVPSADPCDSSYVSPMDSVTKLKAYDDCRFDRIEAKIDALPTTSGAAAGAVTTTAPTTAPTTAAPTPAPATTAPAAPTTAPTTAAPTPTTAPTTSSPATVRVTRFGADPVGSDSSAPVAKYGTGASLRLFANKIAAPTHPTGASIVHTSFSVTGYGVSREQALKDIAAGKHDADITAAAKATPAGDVLELVHEADNKVRGGTLTYATVKAAKNHFYDVVKAAKPSVLVANTVTGWLADPKSGLDVTQWGAIKADVFGIDNDGVHPTVLPYTNYDDEIATAVKFVSTYKASGYRYWAVPEFGCPRISTDTGGAARAKWMSAYGAKYKANGALYADAYEYNSTTNNELTTTAEITAWKALVG